MSTVTAVQSDVVAIGMEQKAAADTAAIAGRVSDYLQLCRPRIAVMSAAAAAAGFTLASTSDINWNQLVLSLAGIVLFVASASILNQVLERDTDRKMGRTATRPLVCGRLSPAEGWILGIIAGTSGTILLGVFVNQAVCLASIFTMLTYVFLYTPAKRTSSLCTTIGAVPGAMPPVLGWLAAGGETGMAAVSLFAVFFVWQFPHFLAIGWLYRDQYERAGLRMLPSFRDSGKRAGLIALLYAVAFVPVSILPRFAGLAGTGYLCAAFVLSGGYLWLTFRFCIERNDLRARQLMVGSLLCLPALLISLVLDYVRLTS